MLVIIHFRYVWMVNYRITNDIDDIVYRCTNISISQTLRYKDKYYTIFDNGIIHLLNQCLLLEILKYKN